MLTIQYLYYNQPQAITFFETQGFQNYPVNFLFIDDGSREPLKLNWPNATVLRIEQDIPWNMPAANNLGFNHLFSQDPEAVVLRMDIDHYFKEESIHNLKLDAAAIGPKEIIQYKRLNTTPHPNIYMARVEDLLKAGGYNLDFCGNYGYDDKELNYRLRKRFFSFSLSPVICHVNHSLRSHGLDRDKTINYEKYQKAIQ